MRGGGSLAHGKRAGVRGPLHFAADVVLTEGAGPDEIASVLERLSPPLVVKPATGGSSVATSVVSTQEDLLYAVLLAFQHSSSVLVEQFVRGREVTVAVVEDWRGEIFYAFPPVEIRPSKSTYFDYAEKYEGHARKVCPAPLPQDDTQALLSLARDVHQALNLRDYSRSDFIVARDGIYFLEVNTLPGLTPTSLLPKAVDATGATLSHFLDHLVTRALARR